MTATGDGLYADLPDELAQRLADPPVTEKKLLELGVAWTGLSDVQARMAELLRLFVITWDPLDRLAARPEGFATINVDTDGTEIVVYVPVWWPVASETCEQLAGSYLLDVESIERATEIVTRDPAARFWAVEVRPIMDTAGSEM